MSGWKIYTTVDDPEISWKEKSDQEYLRPLVGETQNLFFPNLKTTLLLASNGDTVIPLTVNDAEYGNCYLCSPYDHYVSYAKEEIENTKSGWPWSQLKMLFPLVGFVLKKAQVNRSIMVNNWLFSTNLHPEIEESKFVNLRKLLRQQFPTHAILYRSLDRRCHEKKISSLVETGCHTLPLRMVYYAEGATPDIFETRIYGSDRKLALKSDYKFEIVKQDEEIAWERLAELYRMLYIEKYSACNLEITSAFFEHAFKSGKVQFGLLKNEGRIDGMVGFYSQNGVMTAPYFGYDTQLPAELRISRLLAYYLLEKAREDKILFNQSSGAGQFKTLRRAKPFLEYLVVDVAHLPRTRRFLWKSFIKAMSKFGEKIMSQW